MWTTEVRTPDGFYRLMAEALRIVAEKKGGFHSDPLDDAHLDVGRKAAEMVNVCLQRYDELQEADDE